MGLALTRECCAAMHAMDECMWGVIFLRAYYLLYLGMMLADLLYSYFIFHYRSGLSNTSPIRDTLHIFIMQITHLGIFEYCKNSVALIVTWQDDPCHNVGNVIIKRFK